MDVNELWPLWLLVFVVGLGVVLAAGLHPNFSREVRRMRNEAEGSRNDSR